MSINKAADIVIVGADGRRWTVSGEGMGDQGVMLDQDPEGLFDEAPFTSIWQTGATQDGATYLGGSTDPIDLVLGFTVCETDTEEWADVSSAFLGGFTRDPRKGMAQIEVTLNDETRILPVLKLEKSKTTSKVDPNLTGESRLQLTLRAPLPFWEGDTLTSTFVAKTSNELGYVTIENPTDVDLWLTWAMAGPGRWTIMDIDLTSDVSRPISTPLLASGQNLTVDTHPRNETYVASNGANIAGQMRGREPLFPIPAKYGLRVEYPVTIANGPASGAVIQARMRCLWQRPFGGGKA